MEKESVLFTPGKIGPLTLRNRTIRAAAFESMCPGNAPSDMLYDYHKSVAVGGIGMTTLAYAAVTQSGLSFERQLWMRPDIIPGLNVSLMPSTKKERPPPYNSDIAGTCPTKISADAGLSPHPAVSISIPPLLSGE